MTISRLPLSEYPGYAAYMRSPEWKSVMQAKFRQVGRRCQGCGGDERIEVHHLTYDRFGRERLEDLQVLCHLCHAREHGRAPCVGPVAGPTASDLTARVRERERTDSLAAVRLFRATAEGIVEICASLGQEKAAKAFVRQVRAFERHWIEAAALLETR